MATFPFEGRSSSQPSSMASPDRPPLWLPDGDSKERAVAHLLRHGVLSHLVGRDTEYKVRTTVETRRGWQYRCDVLCRDKPVKWAFSPIVVDRTAQLQHSGTEPDSIEASRQSLVEEAVGVHFTRCAALREYLTLASIYSPPSPLPKRRYRRLVILVGVGLLTVYGVWSQVLRPHSGQAPVATPTMAQRVPQPVTVESPAPAPKPTPVPPASSNTRAEITNVPATAPAGAAPAGTPSVQDPKRVQLGALLTSGSSGAQPAPASTAEATSESSEAELEEGDLLLFTGWVHWISRAPDGTYELYLTPTPRSRASGLIAAVPPPHQDAGSPTVERQLSTVRSFITQRLLRQQKPSSRRSLLSKPIFIQLMGQLSAPDVSRAAAADRKGLEGVPNGWEVRPVLEAQFATPPAPSSRSRSR